MEKVFVKLLDGILNGATFVYKFFEARPWARFVGTLVLGAILRDVAGRLQ